jgi:hypothetical protein
MYRKLQGSENRWSLLIIAHRGCHAGNPGKIINRAISAHPAGIERQQGDKLWNAMNIA